MNATPLDRERLVKLCGMFGSDHPGERANAAAAADKLIRAAGMRWPDVIHPALPPPKPKPEDPIAEAIRFSLRHSEVLTEWEEEFLNSIAAQEFPLSEKQFRVLERLFKKAQRAAAGAG